MTTALSSAVSAADALWVEAEQGLEDKAEQEGGPGGERLRVQRTNQEPEVRLPRAVRRRADTETAAPRRMRTQARTAPFTSRADDHKPTWSACKDRAIQ